MRVRRLRVLGAYIFNRPEPAKRATALAEAQRSTGAEILASDFTR